MHTVKFNNVEIENHLSELEPLLEKTNMVGYIAAMNYRNLNEAVKEYHQLRDKIIEECGEEAEDENGNKVKRVTKGTPAWDTFLERLEPIAGFEHEVQILKMDAKEASEFLTGRQILNLEWMITFAGDQITPPPGA